MAVGSSLPTPCRLLDQLPARAIDRLVHLDELVARLRRIVGRVARIEPAVAEMAGVVGAHEVDAEEL